MQTIQLHQDASDAGGFIEAVAAIIRGAAIHYRPQDVYVIKIGNWFGRRWLGFSHKLFGIAGVQDRQDFVMPPFVPARVTSEAKFARTASGEYTVAKADRPVHIWQAGTMNGYRRVRTEFPGAVFFWWTGRSETNGKGALMCYYPESDGHQGWYVGFANNEGWRISETAAVSPEIIRTFQSADVSAD